MKKFEKILVHAKIHLDELFAVFLLLEYGRHLFDLVSASWEEFTTGILPKGKTWKDFPKCMFIGCGGSPFDEHGQDEDGEETCSARLVAGRLGISKEAPFRKLLWEVQKEDRKGSGLKNHIAHVVKGMTNYLDYTNKEVYEWMKPLFTAIVRAESELWEKVSAEVEALGLSDKKAECAEKYARFNKAERLWLPFSLENCAGLIADQIDKKFSGEWYTEGQKALGAKQVKFEEAMKEIDSMGKTIDFESYRGPLEMLVIKSDNPQIGPASRKKGFPIFIQQNSLGNIIIMTENRKKIWLNEVVKILRQEEACLRGFDLAKVVGKSLSKQGVLNEVPQWYLHEGNPGQLYNGTLTASAVEPTEIALEKVATLVCAGLKPRRKFHKGKRDSERKGMPVSKSETSKLDQLKVSKSRVASAKS